MDNFLAHILVVDDDDGIRSLVKKFLNENNYLVTTADSAEDASEKIKIIKFGLQLYLLELFQLFVSSILQIFILLLPVLLHRQLLFKV